MTIHLTKQGNTVGFTANGDTITGQYMTAAKCWAVNVCSSVAGGIGSLTHPGNRRFATKADAVAYAASLIDTQKTAELAWW